MIFRCQKGEGLFSTDERGFAIGQVIFGWPPTVTNPEGAYIYSLKAPLEDKF